MNVFNRLILILIALLLLVVPIFLLLVNFGVISADVVRSYVAYGTGLRFFSNLSTSDFTQRVRIIITVVGVLVVLIALFFFLRELKVWSGRAQRRVFISQEPGKETSITRDAVCALSEGAAREAGADLPTASLRSKGHSYRVFCDIQVPQSNNYTQLASNVREKIQQVLKSQNVPIQDVEVTIRGTTPR